MTFYFLSDIVRSTGNSNIKKGVERLERHLDSYDEIAEIVDTNFSNIVKNIIDPRHLYFVDGGDITKNENTKFENLGYVLDGSKEHSLAKGYKLFEIDTIDNAGQPLNLLSDLSTSDNKVNDSNKELSENLEWIKRIKLVSNTYGKGTFVLDRGFDGAILMENIIESGNDFIIRAKSLDRIIYVNNEKTKINEYAKKIKGYYKYDVKIDGEIQHLKVSSTNIRIKNQSAKNLKNHQLTLVIIKGFGGTDAYMALLSSKNVNGKNEILEIVNNYVSRWKIEENFKFKKQQYGLEKIKVRKYKRIQILNKLLSIAMIFNNIINLKALGKTLRKIKNQSRKRIKMWLYRITDGIKEVFNIFSSEIMKIIYPMRQPRRRDLFTVMGVSFRMS